MNHKIIASFFIALNIILLPLLSSAQTYSYWRESSSIREKINNLDNNIEESIAIPVLFGASLNEIYPNFGDPRSGGRVHEGQDIVVPKSTPVVSPTEAVVIRITENLSSSQGISVYTANPGGETFVYYHLDRIGEGIDEGDVLKKGDLIGYVGNTGNASGTGDHLHFEIHSNTGAIISPLLRIKEEFTLSEKMSYLIDILSESNNSESLSNLLVSNFRSTFNLALNSGITLPSEILKILNPGAQIITNTDKEVLIAQLLSQIADLQNQIRLLSSSSSLAVNIGKENTFTRDLQIGSVGEDVRVLQKMLNQNGYTVALEGAGSPGNETNFFGNATKSALIKFQTDNKIYPNIGYFGPITRAEIHQI